MQITRENLNSCTVKLNITCEIKEVDEGFHTAFRHLTKKVRLPGFRPGKAPKAMLEPFVDPQELSQQAAEEMIRLAYPKALDEEKLQVDRTTSPHISIVSLDRDNHQFEFSVKVPLPPSVELGDYKGLPLSQPVGDVSEEEVDYELQKLRESGKSHESVTDRGVQLGDMAVLNIKPEGEDAEGKTLVTIAGQNFPALDDSILGMKVEEIKNVELEFPSDYQDKDLAGKSMKAQIALNSLSGLKLPELDDSFAQSLKTENVEDLRNRLREVIGAAKQQMIRTIVHERLVDSLMERSQVAVSDNMWENLASRRLEELSREQQEQDRTLEQYAEENGMSLEEFTSAWEGKAKLEVERALVVQAVYAKEQMSIESRDLGVELESVAAELNMDPAQAFEMLKKTNSVEELHFRALSRKVGDFLLANADVTLETAQSSTPDSETEPEAPADPAPEPAPAPEQATEPAP